MPRSTGTPQNRAAGRSKGAVSKTVRSAETPSVPLGRVKRLETLVDLCICCRTAQRVAEAHGEKLLGFLLAMAAQEGAEAADRQKAAQAKAKPAPSQSR